MDIIKAGYYQTILSYEVTQNVMKSKKFVIQEAFSLGKPKEAFGLIEDLPLEDFLILVEHNVPMIFNFMVALDTSPKVSHHLLVYIYICCIIYEGIYVYLLIVI